jgi:hypothetical protein
MPWLVADGSVEVGRVVREVPQHRWTQPAIGLERLPQLIPRGAILGPCLRDLRRPGVGEPRSTEHEAIAWVTAGELLTYQPAPSDMAFAKTLTATA